MNSSHSLPGLLFAAALLALSASAVSAATETNRNVSVSVSPGAQTDAVKAPVYDPAPLSPMVRDEKEGVLIQDPWLVKSPLTGPSVSALPGRTPSTWTIVKTWVKGRAELPSLNYLDRPDLPRTTSITMNDKPRK